jgi:hypothetical protein
MAHEVYSGKSCEQRIADRLKNSGGEGATHHVQVGTGPTRVHHNIHEYGAQHNHGSGRMGQRDVEFKGTQRG